MNFSIIQSYFDFIQKYVNRDGFFLNINRYEKTSVGDKIRISEYPYDENYFDLVISLGCFHNLRVFELESALKEIERVGKQGYVMVESYRNEQEQFNLQCWALTCESFFDVEEWIWLYDHLGYTGDYEFIFFE